PLEGAVQVHHVQPPRARLRKGAGHRDRVVGIHRLRVGAALHKPDAAAASQVDGRNDDAHASMPFVDGTPLTRGSKAAASFSARATALKAASMMWCSFLPASWRTCSVTPPVVAKARKNSSASTASNWPMRPAGVRS